MRRLISLAVTMLLMQPICTQAAISETSDKLETLEFLRQARRLANMTGAPELMSALRKSVDVDFALVGKAVGESSAVMRLRRVEHGVTALSVNVFSDGPDAVRTEAALLKLAVLDQSRVCLTRDEIGSIFGTPSRDLSAGGQSQVWASPAYSNGLTKFHAISWIKAESGCATSVSIVQHS